MRGRERARVRFVLFPSECPQAPPGRQPGRQQARKEGRPSVYGPNAVVGKPEVTLRTDGTVFEVEAREESGSQTDKIGFEQWAKVEQLVRGGDYKFNF